MSSSSTTKVSLYDLSALKSTTDDALAPLLTTLPEPYKFKQSHYFTNVRLALGYIAVTLAGAFFYADWRLGWDKTRDYTLPTCVAYFVLNSALTLWIWKYEAGKVFVGSRSNGQTLSLASSTRKFDPTYNLTVSYTTPSGSSAKTVSVPFNDLFNIHGFLDKNALKHWLAGNIEVVGQADPVSKKAWTDRDGVEEADEEIISAGAARNIERSTPRQRKGAKSSG